MWIGLWILNIVGIVHGKGTSVLRKSVHALHALKQYLQSSLSVVRKCALHHAISEHTRKLVWIKSNKIISHDNFCSSCSTSPASPHQSLTSNLVSRRHTAKKQNTLSHKLNISFFSFICDFLMLSTLRSDVTLQPVSQASERTHRLICRTHKAQAESNLLRS